MGRSITEQLAENIVEHRAGNLDAETSRATSLHLLDTLAAVVSGSTLTVGTAVRRYAQAWGVTGDSTCDVLLADVTAPPDVAARMNGMLAHADETDDSHQASLTHPGCAVVPACLAMAQHGRSTGREVVHAVAVGYEVAARVGLALGRTARDPRGSKVSTHAFGGVFGAAAAAACLARLDVSKTRQVLSYAAQMAAGTTTWYRDTDHIEKAFVFGGMPASNGVLACTMVAEGFTAVPDVFDSDPSFLAAYADDAEPEWLAQPWTPPFKVTETNFKRYPVGSPAQSLVQAAEEIAADIGAVRPEDLDTVEIALPPETVHVVSSETAPNLNARYLVMTTLANRTLTFAAAHDREGMASDTFRSFARRCAVVADRSLAGTRGGAVAITVRGGRVGQRRVERPYGTAGMPMSEADVLAKARDLMASVVGDTRAGQACERALALAQAPDVNGLVDALRRR